MERLLNFSEPIDIQLLDQVVQTFYFGKSPDREHAQTILTQFQDHPDSWSKVHAMLEQSKLPQTKFFSLQILEQCIKYRWKGLPRDQCSGIKNYILNLIIQLSSDPTTLQRERQLINKLDLILVQIIKQEWPTHWESFVPEIVGASKTNESLCENNMNILKLLSEEVFDFSRGQMTQAKIESLKTSFTKEFCLIYSLCEYILDNSQKPSLLLITLETILRFLNWIPLGYIFETKLIDRLIHKFLPAPMFRIATLSCLTEIAGIRSRSYDSEFTKFYCLSLKQLSTFLPPETDFRNAHASGSEDEAAFIQQLSLFLTAFFKSHLDLLENQENLPLLVEGHSYLVSLSRVDDDEIFKICLEYWNILAAILYNDSEYGGFQSGYPLLLDKLQQQPSPRRMIYSNILSQVRRVLISRMARPEEVMITEDENGEIIKEVLKDGELISLYRTMRETLVYLTHLDYDDAQRIMIEKLSFQVNDIEFSWHNLNTLCWAIGSISGAMSEDEEKKFLVTVIKDLLGLCEMKRGKDNKAVVASNIMYVVGQYPRFLQAHWKFLKTVVNKLFEFMHETHPGVQDMAVDTFLKIAQKCRRKFVSLQPGESGTFLDEILNTIDTITKKLEPSQIHIFYEAVGYMIAAHSDDQIRENLVLKLMAFPNQTWSDIMRCSVANFDYLKQLDTAKSITNILKTNVHVAKSLGHPYVIQLARIFIDMLNIYRVYSDAISNTIANGGRYAASSTIVRAMRTVKREILKLIETFIHKSEDPQFITMNFIPPLLETVLGDYKANIADARDPEVLSLMAVIINKLKGTMTGEIPRIFDHVFECTLEMITKNFEDYPDHRVYFFALLRSVNTHCFRAFFSISPQHFKLVIDSIVWAFKHTMRNIAESGLYILGELWGNVSNSEVSDVFYKTYYLSLLQDLFYVLTDTFHKSGFKLQAHLLLQMIQAVNNGLVNVPLWDPNTVNDPNMNNKVYVHQFVINLLSTSFSNLSQVQVNRFVDGLFAIQDLPTFKNHLRDFLVQLKEFSSQDNSDLYLEEQEALKEQERKRQLSVPGLVKPSEKEREEGMDM